MPLYLAAACGVAVAAAGTSVAIRVLRARSVLDIPNARSSHRLPTVRGGGVGLIFGCLTMVLIGESSLSDPSWLPVILSGSVAFGVIGLTDDLTASLPALHRLVLQALVAGGAVALAHSDLPRSGLLAVPAGVAATLWIVSYVNAFNFMDGINGISAAQMIVAGIALAIVAHHEHDVALEVACSALTVGAIGFAPFNFPTARVFLGDVGSYFAGAWLAGLVLLAVRSGVPPEAALAPVALYAADTGTTLIRRVIRGERWYSAHRLHVYQRLVDLGWSHSATTSFVLVLVAACSTLGLVSLTATLAWRIVADVGVAVVVAGYLASPAAFKRLRPRLDLDMT